MTCRFLACAPITARPSIELIINAWTHPGGAGPTGQCKGMGGYGTPVRSDFESQDTNTRNSEYHLTVMILIHSLDVTMGRP